MCNTLFLLLKSFEVNMIKYYYLIILGGDCVNIYYSILCTHLSI